MNERVKVLDQAGRELSIMDLMIASGFRGITPSGMTQRLQGNHCDCGPNAGEFILLPADAPDVIDDGKRYMICRNCGCYSHL